jgi:hypothetical protein
MTPATQQPQMGLSFEEVWAALMETRAEMHEQARGTEEAIKRMVETVDRTSKTVADMCKRVDKVTENVGGLNRSMGELIETLIAARLWEKFTAYPYNLQRAYQRLPLFDETNRKLTDIDILLADGDYAMAVEVKRELNKQDDVDHHLKRMELILKYPPDQCKGKRLLGAMAGGAVDTDIQDYAHRAGFFVLELAGESVKLAHTPLGFTPREW